MELAVLRDELSSLAYETSDLPFVLTASYGPYRNCTDVRTFSVCYVTDYIKEPCRSTRLNGPTVLTAAYDSESG